MLAAAFAVFIPSVNSRPPLTCGRHGGRERDHALFCRRGVHRTAHREGLIEPQDRRVLYQLLALAAAFLYPFARVDAIRSVRSRYGSVGSSRFC